MVLTGGGKRGVRGLPQPLVSQTAESGEQGALAVSCSEGAGAHGHRWPERCPASKGTQAGDPSPAREGGQPAPSRGAETQ